MNLPLKVETTFMLLCLCFGPCTPLCTFFDLDRDLEDFWCWIGIDVCCFEETPSSSDAPPSSPRFPAAEISSCSLNVTDPSSLNTDRTYLYFHYRRMSPIPFDANNTCMCAQGFSVSVDGNFAVQFYDGNCSLSKGICPSTNTSVNCSCNKSSCSCRESDYLSDKDTPLQTDMTGNNVRSEKDNCTVPLSDIDFGFYLTRNSRTCFPTSGYTQYPCQPGQNDTCTMTFWVFCLCKRGGKTYLCNCESDPHGTDVESDGNPRMFYTNCTDTEITTDVTPSSNRPEKVVEELSVASKIGITLGVILVSILLVLGVFVACLLKERNENRNNKQRVPQELQGRDSEFRNATYENDVEPEVRLPISTQGISNKSVHKYSSIPNKAPATDQRKSNNSSTYAVPDPNIIVTPAAAGAISATEAAYTEPDERMGGNSVQQVYAEPNTRKNQPDAGAKRSTSTYEDSHSPGNNLGSNDTYEASVTTNTSAVMESKIADIDNTEGMYGKPKNPTAMNYVSPRPPYAKVDKLQSSPGHSGIEHDEVANTENYSHIQATLMTDDGAYQKLDRGVDIKMKEDLKL